MSAVEIQPGQLVEPVRRNRAVLGKAVHIGALMRLHELFPDAIVNVEHKTERVPLAEGEPIRMDGPRNREQHSTRVWLDLNGTGWKLGDDAPRPAHSVFADAVCHPDDRFIRREGIKIAFRRALERARYCYRRAEAYAALLPAQDRAAIH